MTRKEAEARARYVWGLRGVTVKREDVRTAFSVDFPEADVKMIMDALYAWREERLHDKTPRHFRVEFDVYGVHDGEKYLWLPGFTKVVLATGFEEAFRIASEGFKDARFVNAHELDYREEDGHIDSSGKFVSLRSLTPDEKEAFRREYCK